ncbi:protein of unknown function [Methylococcus capsulatus]|uniref:Uncharacterized protein n=1 Tax=Methylococcus capsulatus TaxID=414 RepID=A0AA35UHT5_METCP|nr:protein of unknown function [Methylococcus capsulatus]
MTPGFAGPDPKKDYPVWISQLSIINVPVPHGLRAGDAGEDSRCRSCPDGWYRCERWAGSHRSGGW